MTEPTPLTAAERALNTAIAYTTATRQAEAQRGFGRRYETVLLEGIESTGYMLAERATTEALRAADWDETMLDALCDSDNGNNPFYRADADTVSLARELADVVRAALQAGKEPTDR